MISVTEAQAFLNANVNAVSNIETMPLSRAGGRVLAVDVVSSLNVPPADNSAMDGFAVALANIIPDKPYPVLQRICAGDKSGSLRNSVARIFTGAEIPFGADTVVIQENTKTDDQGRVLFDLLPELGANIRRAGQDILKGQKILEKGVELTSSRLALLASLGYKSIDVFQRLKVAFLSSGNELVEPGEELAAGQIYNSNAVLLKSLLEKDGFNVVAVKHVADDSLETRKVISELLEQVDVLICSGGVSVGEEDHVGPILQELGELNLWKLAIKPGKPLAYAKIGDKHCFGLPGNPVSCFVTYHIMVKTFLKKLQGQADFKLKSFPVAVAASIKAGRREEYFRVSLLNAEGQLKANLFSNQSSGVLSSVAYSDGLLRVPAQTVLQAGDIAEFFPY